jgi:hypothetical protein
MIIVCPLRIRLSSESNSIRSYHSVAVNPESNQLGFRKRKTEADLSPFGSFAHITPSFMEPAVDPAIRVIRSLPGSLERGTVRYRELRS